MRISDWSSDVCSSDLDLEQVSGSALTAARGAIFREVPTAPANWRADADLPTWMARPGIVGLAGVDTRALPRSIREHGMPHAAIPPSPDRPFHLDALIAHAPAWHRPEGSAERPAGKERLRTGSSGWGPERYKQK